jgi:hypothetical protein
MGPAGVSGRVSLINTLLGNNAPGGNGSTELIDLGHNLSSDASCTFTNVGSQNNRDPRLASLSYNGGVTSTLALLPGSPAIDAADTAAAPATDQRGMHRPLGLAADIGTFEFGWPPVLQISATTNAFDILAYATSGPTCWLLASTNLRIWEPIATNQFGSDSTVLFHDSPASGLKVRFYRLFVQ